MFDYRKDPYGDYNVYRTKNGKGNEKPGKQGSAFGTILAIVGFVCVIAFIISVRKTHYL